MQSDKISVIVPVYNVELWLEECVNSIRNQSYSNFELLLIDDGSSDKSPAICDGFALTDERIRVIHKENEGASSARNVGIETATGRYITFIDSDDYVDKDYLLKLYNNLNGCSISECGKACFDENGMKLDKFHEPIVLEWEDYLTETNLNGFCSYAACCPKLYERELFSDIRFPVGRIIAEDGSVVYKLVYRAKAVSRIYDALYYCRQRESSISHVTDFTKYLIDTNALFDEKILFFEKEGRDDLVDFFKAKKAISLIGFYKKSESLEQKQYFYRVVKRLFLEFWKKRNVPIKYKLYIASFIILKSLTGNN